MTVDTTTTVGSRANAMRVRSFITTQIRHGDTTLTTEGVISELNRLYDFRDEQVESFLEENLSLAGLLFEAHKKALEFFGPEVQMALEMVADPEALGDRQLFVLIHTGLSRREARARLSELDTAWWLDTLPSAEGKMEIDLD